MTKLLLLLSLSALLVAGCSPDSLQTSFLDATISKIQSGANNPQQPGATGADGPQLTEKIVGSILLRPTKLLGGTLELLIPAEFAQMDDHTIKIKYPNQSPPTVVLTNTKASVNIAINHTHNSVAPNQLTQLHRQLDSAVRQSQPSAVWKFSGLQQHHGREWIQLEFQSDAVDTKIHNIMMATSAGGKMLVVSFNCTDEQSVEWLDVGREIVNSCQVQGR